MFRVMTSGDHKFATYPHLYHGTGRNFDQFEAGHANGFTQKREGFYFTDDRRVAEEFGDGGYIIEATVAMQNPLDLRNEYENKDFPKVWALLPREYQEEVANGPYSRLLVSCINGGWAQTPEFIKATREAGFDGLIMQDSFGHMGFDSYIAFESSQIHVIKKEPFKFTATAAATNVKPVAITDSPAFKAWFAGSKITNSNGSPKVVYHGTGASFDTFEQRNGAVTTVFGSEPVQRTGFFFTDNSMFADGFADLDRAREGANVMPCYLSIKKPADFTQCGWPSDEPIKSLVDAGWNYKWFSSTESWEMFDGEEGAELVAALKKLGYDGAIINESLEGQDSVDYIAFDPHQIKSAIGNSGKFDAKNPSITASVTPDVTETPAFKAWFAGSKLVDQGKPIRLYHGTCANVGAFDKHPFAYFTAESKYAEAFADGYEGSNIMPVYVKMVNPFDARSWGVKLIDFKQFSKALSMEPEALHALIEEGDYQSTYAMGAFWGWVARYRDLVREILEKQGYDGIIQNETIGVSATTAYITFRPDQVKSAVGNSTFDAKNPSITASKTARGMMRLYRGMEQPFDEKYDLAKTDAPSGYSTWTDNPALAREYAGANGYVYQIDLPISEWGTFMVDKDGERPLFLQSGKKAGLNGVSGNEFLVNTHHDNYSPSLVKLKTAASKTAAREVKPISPFSAGWLTWNGVWHAIKVKTTHARAALRLGLATRGSGDSEDEINLEALQGGNIRIMGTEFEAWEDNAETRDLIAKVLEVSKFPHVTIEFRNQVEGYGRAYERNMSVESALQWMYSGVRPGFDKNSASKTAMDRQSRNAHYFIQWLVRKGCPYDGSVRPYHSSSVTVTFPSGNLEVTFDRNAPEIKGTETVYVGPGGVTPIEARRMVSQRMREAIKEGNTLKDGEWVAPEKEVPTLRFTLDEQSRKSGFLLIMVDTQKLDQEWARPANNVRLAPGSMENHIGTRYARFEQWLKDNPGTPIEAPYVSWDTYPTPDKGGVHFNNGRHRFAVLRDMGAQKVGIAISKEQLPYFKPIMVGGSKTAAVVDNPKFQAWFKGSKITDSHGRPLIMYHGTNQNFDKFDLAKQGEKDSGWYGAGIYLTADTDTASGYAVYNKLKDDSPADGANVMPLYVKMVSPYYWPKDRKAAMNREEAQAITEELKASGHDGVVVHNEYADPSVANHYEVVVFSPNQIKSAIGNSGEFNPKKHNITAADEIEIQEHRITAEESAFEGTTAPGMRIEAHSDEGTVAALEIYFDKGNAYVRGITVASHYRGQGIGQKLYDRAIVLAKEEGCAGFYSDKSNCMSNDAHKAWDRLRKRYKVEFEPGEDGYDASGRKKINLKTATSSPSESRSETIIRWAGECQDQFSPGEPGYALAEDLKWREETINLHKLQGFDAGEYDHLDEEYGERLMENSDESVESIQGLVVAYHKAIQDGSIERIFVVEGTDGLFYVWDGNHRVGSAHVLGVNTMPAFVGYRKGGKTAAKKLPEYQQVPHPLAGEPGGEPAGTMWQFPANWGEYSHELYGKEAPTRIDITNVINELVQGWGSTPYDINCGDCQDFAEAVIAQVKGAEMMEASDSIWLDCADGNHFFVKFQGRYYDAEAPMGVKSWRDLPLFHNVTGKGKHYKKHLEKLQNGKLGAATSTYYHVTPHIRTSKILKQGLVLGKQRQWKNQDNKALGDRNKIYLMNHLDAAIRWASKMEWNKQAKIDILKIEMNIPDIEPDMNLEAQMNKIDGKHVWMMTSMPVPPEAIKQVIPLTTQMKQDFVKRQNERYDKLDKQPKVRPDI